MSNEQTFYEQICDERHNPSDEPEPFFGTAEIDAALVNLGKAFASAIGAYWLADKLLVIINWWEARGK